MAQTLPDSLKPYLKSALSYLSLRDRSTHELETHLQKRLPTDSQSASNLVQLIEYLVYHNLINDSRFAQSWLEAKVNRGYGPNKIRHDLHARGIAPSIINQVIQSVAPASWIKAAFGQLNKRQNRWLSSSLHPLKLKSRQLAFLSSRGFLVNQSLAAIDQWSRGGVK